MRSSLLPPGSWTFVLCSATIKSTSRPYSRLIAPRAVATAASVGVNVGVGVAGAGLGPGSPSPSPSPFVAGRHIASTCFVHRGVTTRFASSTPPHPSGVTIPAYSRSLHPRRIILYPPLVGVGQRTTKTHLARMSNGGNPVTSTEEGGEPFPTIRGKTLVSVQDCLDATSSAAHATATAADDPRIIFVDGSWYHTGGRDGRSEFEAGPRIRGARYVDMDDVAAQGELFPELNPKGLPHMMPPKHLFAAVMDALDIKNSDHVVVYGHDGCIFTPRTWFLFRAMGHDPGKIHLLQGSYEDWVAAGGAVDTHPTTAIRVRDLDYNLTEEAETATGVNYRARDAKNVCDMDFVLNEVVGIQSPRDDAHGSSPFTLLDSRGSSFVNGHIPGAIHVPYSSLVKEDNQLKFKDRDELEAVFQRAGVDVKSETPIVCSCGSGVSVCHLVVALEECGRAPDTTIIYDGSWTEWGADPDSPKVTSS